MERKHRALLLALPTVLTLLFFFVAPMVYILVHTLHENGLSDFVNFFSDPFYRNILWVTFRVSLVSTAISLVLGYPTAFYMARTKSRMKQVMMIVILFPFLVSAVVRSYGWMVILGTNGLLNQLLQTLGLLSAPLKILNTETAVIIGMIHLLVPYMVLSLVGVLQSIDPNVEYAAYSLGASPLQTFSKVVFPLSLPGIISGCVLVFTMSMTSYVTPKLLGGSKFRMMATMVVQEINVNFDWGAASAISYILLAVILLVQISVVIFAILVMLFLLAPLVVIVIASFTPTALITFPPQGFSLKWYANIFGSSTHFMDGLVNSLKIGILATALDILLGVTAALSVCRYSFKGKDALLNYYTSPMYVPSVAFAFVLLQVYSQIGGVSGMLRIFIGHLIIILPYIVRNTVSVLHVFNWTLEDAATSMGATPIQVFFKITIPLARPGIMAGALLAFLYSFDEVALSSLLSTPRFITLPIRIMNYMELTFDPTLAAISTLLILASLVLIVLMEKFVGLDMFVK